jgi:hypothetical protein
MQPTTLKNLGTSDLVTLFAMWDALTDISQLLAEEGLPDSAVRSGVRHILEDRLPPLSMALDWPPARLAPGSTPADAAGMISGLIGWHEGPATALFTQLAGAPVSIEVTRCAHRAVDPDEAGILKTPPGIRVYERWGVMTAGTLTVASTRLVLVPSRLPGEAWAAIQAGQPAGEALEPYGMRRDRRRVCLSRLEATVDASAVLYVGRPVGLAEEHVSAEMCAHVAAVDR